MYTPSAPFEKAWNINAGSILPVHMTLTSLISGEYCSLETPARSARPYPHQKHKKPKILGLNSVPDIHSHLTHSRNLGSQSLHPESAGS